MGKVVWHEYDSPEWLVHALSQEIVGATLAALDKNGHASWALSGGSSPKKLYQALAKEDLPWSKLTCLLTDERCLADGHPKTNAALVWNQILCQHPEVHWVPLWDAAQADFKSALEAGASRLDALAKPVTCTLLGMGPDGHTASLFPGCASSQSGLQTSANQQLVLTNSPQYPKQRISLTLPMLLDTENLYLLIMGARKREVLKAGLKDEASQTPLPIHQLIEASAKTLHVYWSPSEKIRG